MESGKQAKIKQGGNFTNSRFEELYGTRDVSVYVKRITSVDGVEARNFGLHPIAAFSTTRETWIADEEFHIILDTMDFGHEVGEVELQQVLACVDGKVPNEQQKQRVMQGMDDKIAIFTQKYSWAFSSGEPKGKLTAYFERSQING